jgi:hypothetical protein
LGRSATKNKQTNKQTKKTKQNKTKKTKKKDEMDKLLVTVTQQNCPVDESHTGFTFANSRTLKEN